MDNNLFNYATKELSQDAVLCWILKWVNYPQDSLYELGCRLFYAISGEEINKDEKIEVLQQKEKTDIVVIVPSKQRIIIIEDKVYSSEHDNQIDNYRKAFEGKDIQKGILGFEPDPLYSVSTVYLKTGFYSDDDKMVKADKKINGRDLYGIVADPKYEGMSEILDSYVEYLKEFLNKYDEHADICGKYKNGAEYFVSWDDYTQYKLMRFMFPEEMWDGSSKQYKVESGSSSGRPWTELEICPKIVFGGSNDSFELFWRIDSSVKGPYLSFRLYEGFDKSDKDKLKRHNDCYDKMKTICEQIINENTNLIIRWEDVDVGYRGNYKESALFEIKLIPFFEEWNEKGDLLAENVRLLTNEILSKIKDVEF